MVQLKINKISRQILISPLSKSSKYFVSILFCLFVFAATNNSFAQDKGGEWIGTYLFEENVPWEVPKVKEPKITYTVKVFKEKDKLLATVEADGIQTKEFYFCTAKAVGDVLNFYYLKGGMGNNQKKHNFLGLRVNQLFMSLEKILIEDKSLYLLIEGAYGIASILDSERPVYFRKID